MGGGTGGHITPILAVAHALKAQSKTCEIIYIGQRGDSLGSAVASSPYIDTCFFVHAGKFRRYHGEGVKQLADVKTLALNVRDVSRVLRGLVESLHLLNRLKPDVVFVKGGYVGVPVGLAAAQLKIPYITHDSDAIPGLANRIIAKWAALHAVALDARVYTRYNPTKTVTVGVPVRPEFAPVTEVLQRHYKEQIGLEKYDKVMLITGGGLGADRLNRRICELAPNLLDHHKNLAIIHIAGTKHEQAVQQMYVKTLPESQLSQVKVLGFVSDMYAYSGAADIIVARAGATTIAEFAMQQKACVVVPSPFLTGGHQLKNAAYWAEQDAIFNVSDIGSSEDLLNAIDDLLKNKSKRQTLAKNLSKFAHPHAATELAKLILQFSRTS